MVKVQLRGRFGNHLFQYAFAKITARKNKTFFLLDVNHVQNPMPWMVLDFPYGLFHNKSFFKLYNYLQKKINLRKERDYSDCTQSEINLLFENDCFYKGYFQYSHYLEENRDMLLKTFKIKKKEQQYFNSKYKELFEKEKSLVISFRFGDYRTTFLSEYGYVPVLMDFNWYYSVLKTMDLSHYSIFIISDEIEYVEENFKLPDVSISFIREQPAIQFQMLTHANVAVLSNSTFAWWGGFLNEVPGSRIIAPKYFLGHQAGIEFPNGIQTRLFEWV